MTGASGKEETVGRSVYGVFAEIPKHVQENRCRWQIMNKEEVLWLTLSFGHAFVYRGSPNMPFREENKALVILLPLIFLLCAFLWMLRFGIDDYESIYYQDGYFDLCAVDFDKLPARLMVDNDIEYVPHQLLTPEEFTASSDVVVGMVEYGVYSKTTRARIIVPEYRMYTFVGYNANYSSKLFVNGALLMEIGTPGLTAEETIPGEKYISFTAYPEDGIIEIVQQSANYSYDEISRDAKWRVGYSEMMLRLRDGNTMMPLLMIGIYLLLFIVHFTLFLMKPSNQANLYLALLCFVWMARNGVVGVKVFLLFFPSLGWDAAFRMEYLSIPAAIVLFIAAYNALFPRVFPKVYRYTAYAVSAVFALFFLVADTFTMSQSIVYIEVVAVLLGIFWLVRLIAVLRRPSSEQSVLLLGLGVVVFCLLLDVLYYNGVGSVYAMMPRPSIEYALMIFSLFQMVAMFFATMKELAMAQETERLASAEKDLLTELNQLRSGFYADLSHEMKTPLTVISSNAQFVARQMKKGIMNDEIIVDLNDISNEAHRLARMVTGLVSLNRIHDAGTVLTPLLPSIVVEDTVRMYHLLTEKNGNILQLQMDEDLPMIMGNADQLSQVLINLMSNANRHTRQGSIVVRAVWAEPFIRIEVEDTGDGVPEDLLPHVFERFTRGDEAGIGLGLAICKTIIESHGGEMGIESAKGEGTKVWFLLPPKGE